MFVIHTSNSKLASIDCLECINAKFNAREELSHRSLNRGLIFYHLFSLLGVLVVFSGASYKFLEDTILQFKAHLFVIIELWSETLVKYRIIVNCMELNT